VGYLLYILPGAGTGVGISPLEKTKPFSGMRVDLAILRNEPGSGGFQLFEKTNPISVGFGCSCVVTIFSSPAISR
jgi:hypothetical protein